MSDASTPVTATSRFAAVRSRRAVMTFVGITLAVLVADLVLKYVAFRTVAGRPVVVDVRDPSRIVEPGDPARLPAEHDAVVVVPRLLSLKLTTNTGAVFGIGKGGKWFFVAVSVVAVGALGWFFARSDPRGWGLHVALGLTLAGALGNLYDRVRYNAVRDMLWMLPEVRLPWGLRWPGMGGGSGSDQVWPWIFNLADAALMVGVGMIVAITWWHELRLRRGGETGRS